ncbi:MAG: hypothetical protein A2086_07250 [Spirochaetes bacterium GWD1_27_9]|nr:MAG: hypothetical protein A2Z98_11695 [Spirochaetes bacterium GWB1_27_13]OHD22026.1 MAG: hypothetical protein A2Y34_06830 [Spirochaetes bacterium GWC1_27_15]OHD32197.1 MAG: hypothetical protein A2086_07250 [Spirochaetes bacterium GWD1_27_9]
MKKILIGCGILKKEINYLIEKNNWEIEVFYLDSSLHINFDKLYNGLKFFLEKFKDREKYVFYGCCHPQIDDLLKEYNCKRTIGQNCIEILLGNELFTEELTNGAFFLLEDWCLRFDFIFKEFLCWKEEMVKMVLKSEHKYFCCIKTPCSNDFYNESDVISRKYDIPIKWLNVNLDNLNNILKQTFYGN